MPEITPGYWFIRTAYNTIEIVKVIRDFESKELCVFFIDEEGCCAPGDVNGTFVGQVPDFKENEN